MTAPPPSAQPKTSAELLQITSFSTGVLVFLVFVWSLLGHKLKNRYLTEGSTACLLGLLTGMCLLAFRNYIMKGVIKDLLVFDSAAFFTYLLPPVIFYAGISVERKLFFSNLGSIMAYGVLGTGICFIVTSIFLVSFTPLHVLKLQDCLALGAIFSATDSVATLQVLDQDSMPRLFSLVFGEGVINDATSVVLIGAITRMFSSQGGESDADGFFALVLGLLQNFLYLFVTSFALGLATGLGIAFLLKHLRGQAPHHEVALISMLAYLSYLLAEVLGLSGILSLFCCGLAVAQFAMQHVSDVGRVTTKNAFKTMCYLSEGIIFIYVGMDALDPVKWHASYAAEAVWLITVLMVLLVVSRAASVVPISMVLNMWSHEKLTSREITIIWWSGLMRGAVSVALVYYHFDNQEAASDRHRSTLIVTTLVCVLFTILVFGAVTQPLLDLMLDDPDKGLLTLTRERLAWLRQRLGRWCCSFRRRGGGGGLAYSRLQDPFNGMVALGEIRTDENGSKEVPLDMALTIRGMSVRRNSTPGALSRPSDCDRGSPHTSPASPASSYQGGAGKQLLQRPSSPFQAPSPSRSGMPAAAVAAAAAPAAYSEHMPEAVLPPALAPQQQLQHAEILPCSYAAENPAAFVGARSASAALPPAHMEQLPVAEQNTRSGTYSEPLPLGRVAALWGKLDALRTDKRAVVGSTGSASTGSGGGTAYSSEDEQTPPTGTGLSALRRRGP